MYLGLELEPLHRVSEHRVRDVRRHEGEGVRRDARRVLEEGLRAITELARGGADAFGGFGIDSPRASKGAGHRRRGDSGDLGDVVDRHLLPALRLLPGGLVGFSGIAVAFGVVGHDSFLSFEGHGSPGRRPCAHAALCA